MMMMMMMLSKWKSGLSTRCFPKVRQQEGRVVRPPRHAVGHPQVLTLLQPDQWQCARLSFQTVKSNGLVICSVWGYFAFSHLLGMKMEDPRPQCSAPLILGPPQFWFWGTGPQAQTPQRQSLEHTAIWERLRVRWRVRGDWWLFRPQAVSGTSSASCDVRGSDRGQAHTIPHGDCVSFRASVVRQTDFLFPWWGRKRGVVNPHITWPRTADPHPAPRVHRELQPNPLPTFWSASLPVYIDLYLHAWAFLSLKI